MHARKRFGQHFLEPAWVAKVVEAIAPRADEDFIEIGPGAGALTRPLSARARSVAACEIDRDLAAALRETSPSNVTVVEGDFLELDAGRLRDLLPGAGGGGTLRVAGNLPYYVASPILFRLIELTAELPIADATVMLQREVADRLTAAPGTHDYGVLAILVRRRAEVDRLLALPPGAFRPPPKVRSSLLRLRFHQAAPPAADEAVLVAMVRAIFTRRRKTLANALSAFPLAARFGPTRALGRAAIDPVRRPETLDAAELVRLADVLAAAR